MQTLMSHLRPITARLSPGRAVVAAMLIGPVVGALLAFGAVAAEEPNVVTIDNFTFAPPELTVAVGTTVKWVNQDEIPHNVVNKEKASGQRRSTPTIRIPLRSPVPAPSIISAACIRICRERSSSSNHAVRALVNE